MRKTTLLIVFCLLTLNMFARNIRCVVVTDVGKIRIELYPEKAPLTVANFLKYVDGGCYDGSTFYRVCTPENEKDRKVRIEVIQGGDVAGEGQFAPVKMETTRHSGLRHTNGTLSMARDTPDSGTSSFFICIGDQPELDFAGQRNPDGQGFAAFGKVTRGMAVVRKIQSGANKSQYLIHPVKIRSVRRM